MLSRSRETKNYPKEILIKLLMEMEPDSDLFLTELYMPQ